MNKPYKVFITYAHTNKVAKDELKKRLAVMEKNRDIEIWHDNEMVAGDKWREKISDNLADSDILLYMISADSLASENCNKELVEALESKRNMRIIPIILEQCDWKNHQLSDFQALPEHGKPVNEWQSEASGWQNVVEGIRKTIAKMPRQKDFLPESIIKEIQAVVAFEHGNFLVALGYYVSAIEKYSEMIKIDPKYAASYNNRGGAKYCLGEYEEAIKDYNEAIKLDPTNANAYNNRGNAMDDLGRHEEAIKDYDEAIKLNPKDPEPYYNRGVAKDHLERYEQAIKDYDKSIELNPIHANAYNNRGTARRALERYEEAIEDFDEAIRLNPKHVNAYYNRGIVRDNLEKYNEAIKDYDKAIEINPGYAAAYNNRGAAKQRLKRYEEAIEDYGKVVELNSKHAGAFYNRGICWLCLKEQDKAKKDLITARDKGIELPSEIVVLL